MKKSIKFIIAKIGILSISIMLSGCAIPPLAAVTAPPTDTISPATSTATSTPTESPTATLTPTETSTPKPTLTPTTIPIYTEFGKQAKLIAEILGWEVVLCDNIILEEDWDDEFTVEDHLDRGIFLYREDTEEFFCDFEGHIEEPVTNPFPDEDQYMLEFIEKFGIAEQVPGVKDGWSFALHISRSRYIDSPSTYNADELTRLFTDANSLEEHRTWRVYTATLRAWPLTYAEFVKLRDKLADDFLDITMSR